MDSMQNDSYAGIIRIRYMGRNVKHPLSAGPTSSPVHTYKPCQERLIKDS